VNGMFKNILLKMLPRKEQLIYERKLTGVMKRLKIDDYDFNWDRSSCFIEFNYQEISYRLEHSTDKAKKRGIFLRDGMDCLMELTESLEDLCRITERGTNKLETWISGMEQSSSAQDSPEFEEEFHIRYKSLGRQNHPEYNVEETIPLAPEPSLGEFDENGLIQRPRRR